MARAGRNLALKSLGEVAARLLFAVLFIFAARILGAQEFGRYTFAASLAALAFIGMDLGLNQIFVRDCARHPEQLRSYAGTLLAIKAGLAVLVLAGLAGLCLAMGYPAAETGLVLAVGLMQSLWGLTELGIAGLNAMERMDQEALVRMAGRFLALVLAGGLLFWGGGLWGLVGGLGLANLLAAGLALKLLGGHAGFGLRLERGFLARLFKESVPLALTSVFILVYFRVDMVMLELMGAGFEQIGWYGAGVRIVDATGMLAALVGGAMLPVFSSLAHRDRPATAKLFAQGQRLLWLAGLPAAAGLTMVRHQAAVMIYGPSYGPTGAAFLWLGPLLAFLFINHLQLGILIALGRQRLCARATGICVLVNLGLNLALIPGYGFMGAAAATLITELALFGLCARYVNRELGDTGLLREAMKPAAAALIMAGALTFTQTWPLPIMIAFGAGAYLAALMALRGISAKEVRELWLLVKGPGQGS